MGLEPTRHECHKILSLARLPVPTLPQLIIRSRSMTTANNIILLSAINVNSFLIERYNFYNLLITFQSYGL